MSVEIIRLVNPLSANRNDNLLQAVIRQHWVLTLIGITTMNLCLAAYSETLKNSGIGR